MNGNELLIVNIANLAFPNVYTLLTVEVVHFKLDSGNFGQGWFIWLRALVLIHLSLVDSRRKPHFQNELVHCEISKRRTRTNHP
ncbi:MAG: hypothetical protein F4X92_04580 [Gammaproteobacteria bacterium]|nr:hypothetical protein [Gammaproteobacteria bacterium]